MLSLCAVVGRVDVEDAVRIAVAVVVVDGEGRQQPGRVVAVRAAAATDRVVHGRTKTRHDKQITIGNGDTTRR